MSQRDSSYDETKAPCSTPINISILAISAVRQVDGLVGTAEGLKLG
jgi:hypothetical protein